MKLVRIFLSATSFALITQLMTALGPAAAHAAAPPSISQQTSAKPAPPAQTDATTGEPAQPAITPSAQPTATVTALQPSPVVTATVAPSVDDAAFAGALSGTIVANRTDLAVRFFIEGQTYEVTAQRSLGLTLPRTTAVLNLFNCDAAEQASDACFWDPYLLQENGFYEVVTGAEVGKTVSLFLREAGAPPSNQVWVQNRTGAAESVIVNNELHELPPSAVQEFPVAAADTPVIVNLRNCVTLGDQATCEWAPQAIEAGYYYALVKTETAGPSNTLLTNFDLEGVVASSGETVKQPPQLVCRLLVPTLNVRGGAGLEFPIVAKIRGTEAEPATVTVVGVEPTRQWLQVSSRIATDGWVTSNPDFIVCTGDVAALPVIGAIAAIVPTPTPEPVVVVAATVEPLVAVATAPIEQEESPGEVTIETPVEPVIDVTEAPVPDGEAAPTDAATDTPTAEPTPANNIPAGLARIVVHNGFDQVMRFTLDQKYRPETENLSGEWDLNPGDAITMLVYPGEVAFSASTPWRGLSGNALFLIDKDQLRDLWLYFVPDPDGSGRWNLQY
ncbi:MAG: hypothetical protein IPK16_19650 [Anaerolineales bacterium]|nr:hypothetical protein [Anaerolineales bacterium]